MDIDLPRERHTGSEQQRRPQDAVEAADVLADQMKRVGAERRGGAGPCRARPALAVQVLELVLPRGARSADLAFPRQPPERVASIGPAERREIVEQRVRPHVCGVPLAVRNLVGQRDAPGQPRAGDADVLKSLEDHVAHFVAAILGLDELGMGLQVGEERVVVLGEAEEEIPLANPARLLLVLGTPALFIEVLLLLEGLAALAIQALVLVLEQRRLAGLGRARVVEAAEQLLHGELVAGVRGADEAVVRDSELAPSGFEPRRQLVHERARSLLRGFGRGGDLLPVLVGARQEEGRVAGLPMKAGEGVRQNLFVGVAEMRQAVDVVDRGGDVETLWHKAPGWRRPKIIANRASRRSRRPCRPRRFRPFHACRSCSHRTACRVRAASPRRRCDARRPRRP